MKNMMLTILVLLTLLSLWGTAKNRRMGNKFGTVVGGLFSLGLISVVIIATLVTFGILEV